MVRASSKHLAYLSAVPLLFFGAGCNILDGGDDDSWPRGQGPDAGFVTRHTHDAALAPDAADAGTDADDAGTEASEAGAADLGIAFTVVVLPDTQYYSSSHAEIFAAETRWIVEQKSARNISVALHVGDIVDGANDPAQWMVASSSLRLLDGIVPYVIVPGNHDSDGNRMGLIDNYFAPKTMGWITNTMTTGQIENNYTLVDIGPQQWLVLGLEFGPRDAVLTWADGVLKAFPNLPAIIVTHAYLYGDGTRYDVAKSGMDASQPNFQAFIPQSYNYTLQEGSNDGEQIWQKIIVPNPNVRLVFSGHDSGAARLTSLRPDGSRVHQMLSDYQWLDDSGGSGYLRVLQFDYGQKQVRVQTYSPYLDQFMTDDANQFTLSLEI
ncbi:MAG TPA: metallophosphoesterase [Polyangia bacterium]|jgi:Calcineurin-like phosphoesterase.|nr:metallophosphoesterase [Polyangia bacterium]